MNPERLHELLLRASAAAALCCSSRRCLPGNGLLLLLVAVSLCLVQGKRLLDGPLANGIHEGHAPQHRTRPSKEAALLQLAA